jgi:hypothetical protein
MSGFAKAVIDGNEVNKLLRKYKKIKKYMKSNFYELATMNGTEQIVTKLLEDSPDE